MRTRRQVLIGWVTVLALAMPAAAVALGTQTGQKRAARRAETDRAVAAILRGNGVQAAVARVQYLGEQAYAAELLADALRSTFEDAARRQIAWALSLFAVRSAEGPLLRLTQDEDAVVRMHAVQGLGRLRSKASRAVLPLLSDPSMAVRREAARALGEMRDRKLGAPLMRAAKLEGEPEVRAMLLIAVGHSGDRRQQKALEQFLESSSESTRIAAARGLCGLGAERGFAFARGLLGSKDPYERRAGVALFEGFPAKIVSKQLRPSLEDPDLRVAAMAARVLYEGGDRSMAKWLVVASHQAGVDDRLAIEAELEKLHLSDAQRKRLLTEAGLVPKGAK